MFKSDIDIIGYLIYGAMILVPAIIITDKSLSKEELNKTEHRNLETLNK